jgi:hypothetical protein
MRPRRLQRAGHTVEWQIVCDRDGSVTVHVSDYWLGWGDQEIEVWLTPYGLGCRARHHTRPLDDRALRAVLQIVRALRRALEAQR